MARPFLIRQLDYTLTLVLRFKVLPVIKRFISLITITFCFLLTACSEKSDNIPAFANPATPEYKALAFFDALYNEDDLQKALSLATKSHARIIKSYGSTKGYARYVLNLQFDPGVELKIDRTLSQVETEASKTTSVNVLFTGFYQGDRVNDLREVKFEKIKGKWKIAKIAGDPYARR